MVESKELEKLQNLLVFYENQYADMVQVQGIFSFVSASERIVIDKKICDRIKSLKDSIVEIKSGK